jgi:hypothetical protein
MSLFSARLFAGPALFNVALFVGASGAVVQPPVEQPTLSSQVATILSGAGGGSGGVEGRFSQEELREMKDMAKREVRDILRKYQQKFRIDFDGQEDKDIKDIAEIIGMYTQYDDRKMN